MIRRTVLFAPLFLLLATSALAQQPPRDLHLVGDHWTAWDPPVHPEGSEVYTIVRGDTLWDLAQRFYDDPYLWPQLWENNQYIKDAHWIYPGDPLLIGVEVEEVDSLARAVVGDESGTMDDESDQPTDGILGSDSHLGAPVPLGTATDIYCSGFIGDLEEEFPFSIIGSEYENLTPRLDGEETFLKGSFGATNTVRYGMATGDIVYLDGGRAGGMEIGSEYTVVAPTRRVQHPTTDEVIGRLYSYNGRVRVLSVQEETAIAEIVHACDAVVVGALLKPFEPEPVPLARIGEMRPINYPTSSEKLEGAPVVVISKDDIVALGEDHVVFIDRGADQEVNPGDIFTIYRRNRKPGLPPVVVGELAVLSVSERSSVAKIISSRYTVYVGDPLELK
jgi:hypothetical protein